MFSFCEDKQENFPEWNFFSLLLPPLHQRCLKIDPKVYLQRYIKNNMAFVEISYSKSKLAIKIAIIKCGTTCFVIKPYLICKQKLDR